MARLDGIFSEDRCDFTVALGSESVTIVFDRSKLNLRRDAAMQRAVNEGDVEGMVTSLAEVLTGWDVVDEAGQPVALSAEILLDLPARALENLIKGIGEVATPSSEEGNGLGSTSSTPSVDSSSMPASLPNGQSPSPLPTPSESLLPK